MMNRPDQHRWWIAAVLWAGMSLACEAQTTIGEWKELAVEGKFLLELPGEPKQSTQKADTPSGEIAIKLYALEYDNGNRAFVVAVNDFPAVLPEPQGEEIEQRLDNIQQGQATGCKGKLLSSKKIKLEGYSGREVTIQAPGGLFIRCQNFLVHKTLLQAEAINVNSKDVDRYFASIKLAKGTAPAGGTK